MEINSINTIQEVEKYRNKINEACDKRIKMLKNYSKADELSNKSFGYIKECFESFSPILFKNKDGKTLMNKYIKTIQNSKNLVSLQNLYENIRKANKETDVDFFINNLANENWDINKETINEDVKKLGKILAEAYFILDNVEETKFPNENKELYSAIEYISENKKNYKNIAEYSEAVKVIREYINKNEKTINIFESNNLDETVEKLLEEFNEKYSHKLTNEEAEALKELFISENKEELFNKYKANCSKNLAEAKENFKKEGNVEAAQKLDSVLEQVENKAYSSETVKTDICNLIELSNIF